MRWKKYFTEKLLPAAEEGANESDENERRPECITKMR
jgi:hypothetical protein